MMKMVGVLVLAALLPSCGPEKYDFRQTPGGNSLAWENVGAVPDWYSLNDIHLAFDAAVEDAVAYLARYGAAPEFVRSVARGHQHVGFDAARFQIAASPTGWASGAYFQGSPRIALAFWSRARGNVVPADAPPWTVYSWPQRPDPAFDWGVEPPVFPALGHEIGHAIWGPQFEHSWTPPAVAGYAVSQVPDWGKECVYAP